MGLESISLGAIAWRYTLSVILVGHKYASIRLSHSIYCKTELFCFGS